MSKITPEDAHYINGMLHATQASLETAIEHVKELIDDANDDLARLVDDDDPWCAQWRDGLRALLAELNSFLLRLYDTHDSIPWLPHPTKE